MRREDVESRVFFQYFMWKGYPGCKMVGSICNAMYIPTAATHTCPSRYLLEVVEGPHPRHCVIYGSG